MNSKIKDFVTGYEKTDSDFKESRAKTLGRRFSAKVIGGVGSHRAKALFNNKGIKLASRLSLAIAKLPLRSFGILNLFFGITTLLLNFADYYFSLLPGSPATDLIVGAVFTLIAVPLLLTDTPLIVFLQKWTFTDTLFFEILCLRRVRYLDDDDIKIKGYLPPLAGILLAVIGFFPPILIVLGIMLITVLIALTFSSPEFTFILTLFCLPLFPLIPMPTLALSVIIMLTSASFTIKVLLGKRRFHFERYDAVLFMMMIFILASGIFNNTIREALSTSAMIFAYFLAGNIIVNRRIAENAVKTIIASSIPTAIYAIISYFISNESHPEWIDPIFSDTISKRAFATFGNPNIYSVYLLVAIIFCAVFAFDKSDSKNKTLYGIPFILNLAALILTWTRGAWLALLLSIVTHAIIKSRRCPKILLMLILAIPVGIVFIPDAIKDRILSIVNLSDSSVISRLSIWRSSLRMLAENVFTGVGIGSGAFPREFLKFAEDSVSAPHAHNIFLQIGCEAGIFTLALFVHLLFIRIRHRASYARYVRYASVGSICTMAGCALFALVLFGMTDHIFYNSQMTMLFFTVFGIGSATLRISKNEYEDAKVGGFGDNSDTAAEVLISIRD